MAKPSSTVEATTIAKYTFQSPRRLCLHNLLMFIPFLRNCSSFSGMTTTSSPLVVILSGPTAVGKSRVAQALSEHLQGVLVSADSVQVYTQVEIGANKPALGTLERQQTLLLDMIDYSSLTKYSAGEWRRDALYAIRELTGTASQEQQESDDEEEDDKLQQQERHTGIREAIQHLRNDDDNTQSLVPIVVGGTMMYLEWLVYGRPDASKPTPEALQQAQTIIDTVQELSWREAVDHVKHLLSEENNKNALLFQQKIDGLSENDWYRLRRILEVAHTSDDDKSVFGGERQGGLLRFKEQDTISTSPPWDVRCLFLCPSDRMRHTVTVDARCEHMIQAGLLQETANLFPLPDMVNKAIGYRQTLDYLGRENPQNNDEAAFLAYLAEFAAVTRRYAKKQMQWFRKDVNFMFVGVDDNNDDMVDTVLRLVQQPRADYDAELQSETSASAQTRANNEAQGKGMKFYQYKPTLFTPGSEELAKILQVADACTLQLQEKVANSATPMPPTSWHLSSSTVQEQ